MPSGGSIRTVVKPMADIRRVLKIHVPSWLWDIASDRTDEKAE
ncbi:hypothetical protein FBZ81_12455 [Azospirillum brasilense]|jgi:hypothetical protein|nr:hypothetical protein OH82_02298 [Azospirillum brasilense]TWB69696.1 hypothetical protein FBZ81_12455 [Azospirillum brasilense]